MKDICGDCFASSAIRLCFVDTVSEFRCIRCVSQIRFHNSVSRFPPPGSTGRRSPSSSVLSRHYDFLSPVSRHFVSFVRRYHGCTRAFALARSSAARASLELVPGISVRDVSVETTGSPKFLGNPNYPFAHALRLRRDGHSRPPDARSRRLFFRATAWPLLRERQRLSQ